MISSELEPLDVERTILSGDGVETDIRRVLSSGLTGEAGVTAPVRTAGVMDLCPIGGNWADADRACMAFTAPTRAAIGEWIWWPWLYGVGDVGDVALDRGSDAADEARDDCGRRGEVCREATDVAGGAVGDGEDWFLNLLSSARRD